VNVWLHAPVPIVQDAGWTLGPVWTCAENLAPTGFRSPARPVGILTELSRPTVSYNWQTK
jgi:hypothetical protein